MGKNKYTLSELMISTTSVSNRPSLKKTKKWIKLSFKKNFNRTAATVISSKSTTYRRTLTSISNSSPNKSNRYWVVTEPFK